MFVMLHSCGHGSAPSSHQSRAKIDVLASHAHHSNHTPSHEAKDNAAKFIQLTNYRNHIEGLRVTNDLIDLTSWLILCSGR